METQKKHNLAESSNNAAALIARVACSGAKLVAVSKKQPADRVQAVLDAGQRVFGENYVQEAMGRWENHKAALGVELHLIGPLQTNKAADAVALFDVIQTVDREKLVDALAREMQKQGRNLPCFIQVNTGAEPQKGGVSVADLPALLVYARAKGVRIVGLMCIPPESEPAGLHFALLKSLADRHGLPELSMGMSTDWELAARAGATYVRIGTALFGHRD